MDSGSFFQVLATACAVFVIVFIGAFLRKKEKLSDQVDHSLMWLLINLLLPSLIVNSILKNPALDHLENIVLAPLFGFCSVLIGLGLAVMMKRFAKLETPGEKKSFLLANSINNYGFLPIPLVLTLYDRETLGVLFLHNVGVEAAIWSVGLMIISPQVAVGPRLKKLINPPLCAIAVCLLLTYFDLDTNVPDLVFTTTKMLGQAAIPLALLLVGSLMYDSLKTVQLSDGLRVACSSIAVRLLMFPLCYLLFMWVIPMSLELKRVMLVEAAQPAAMLPIMLAKQYGASPQVAFIVIFSTSLLSLLTMPLWIHFGTYLVQI